MKEFTTKRDCCINLQSLIIQGIFFYVSSIIETPFKDGKYTHGEGSFYRLLPHHITVDDSLSDFEKKVLTVRAEHKALWGGSNTEITNTADFYV